jgi:hypothetical protein
MKNWKTTTNVKKIQRHVNSIVRAMNKNIYNDELWKGRFYVRQTKRRVEKEDDWVYVRFEMEFVDRQTGKTKKYYYDKSDMLGTSTWKFFQDVNDFIVEVCDVWREDPRPNRETSIDYRKVK